MSASYISAGNLITKSSSKGTLWITYGKWLFNHTVVAMVADKLRGRWLREVYLSNRD